MTTVIQTITTCALLYFIWRGDHIAIATALTLQAIANAAIAYTLDKHMEMIKMAAGLKK